MKKIVVAAAIAALAAVSAFAPPVVVSTAAAQGAQEKTYTIGALTITAPWTRVTPKGAKVAGGYVRISNAGTEADRLTGGAFDLSARVEVHEMAMDGGVMRMRHLAPGLEIAPGQTVELRPGGYHLMFVDLKGALEAGKPVKGRLMFEKAGVIDVEFAVAPLGATSPSAGAHRGGHGAGHGHH